MKKGVVVLNGRDTQGEGAQVQEKEEELGVGSDLPASFEEIHERWKAGERCF